MSTNNQLKILPLFLCVILLLSACSKKNVIPLGHEIRLESISLGEERIMSIYLPEDYEQSLQRYPVLYVLDGNAHFHHASGAAHFLSNLGYIPQMIVVAIQNIDRNRDFSPIHVDNIPTSGGADNFLAFVGDELLPYINEHYKTSSYDVIMGHSFGGVFITYSLLERPELFNAYISISPFLQFAEHYMVKKTEEKLLSSFKNDVSFYLCVGEEPDYYEAITGFSDVIYERKDPKFHYEFRNFFIDEDHNTMPYIGMEMGLRYIFSDWRVPDEFVQNGLSVVDRYYAEISWKYGVNNKASEALINLMGYTYLQNGNNDEAIRVFKENIKRYPNSPNVYDSLGETYETNGQLNLAKENYKKAYDLALEQDNPFLNIFQANYERVKQP